MKRSIMLAVVAAVVLSAGLVAGAVDEARAAPVSSFVGDWEAIHPDPATPNAQISIRGHHVAFSVRLYDPDAGAICPLGGAAQAHGNGRLDASGQLVVDMKFRCLTGGSRSVVPYRFFLAPGSPDEMADQTGLVWHRVGR